MPFLRARGTLTNRGTSTTRVDFGACGLRLLAFKTADRSGTPVWDSNARRPWQGTYGVGCILILYSHDIAPGDSMSRFAIDVPLIEMLADSLPDGRYYFAADIGLANRASFLRVPAGDANLAMARQPLAVSRISDLLIHTALPVDVSNGAVRARATSVLGYAGSALVEFSRDCPITLYAYRDKTRRDAAPRSGTADWTQPLPCGSEQTSAVLYRGEGRTHETSVAVRDILGASLPSGRYYFAVAVRAAKNRVFLSTGEADLTRP
jgi:hypothetical protein